MEVAIYQEYAMLITYDTNLCHKKNRSMETKSM